MSNEIIIKGEGVTAPRINTGRIFQTASVNFGVVTTPIDLRPFKGSFISILCWPVSMSYAIGATALELAALDPNFTGSGPNECVYLQAGYNLHRCMLRPNDNFIAATPNVVGTAGRLVVWVSSDRHGGVDAPYP